MATFLFKTEPDAYSFDDLLREERATWDGVSNPQALGFLREAVIGDHVLIYETGKRKAIVGLAEIASEPYPDPSRPEANAHGEAKFPVVEIVPIKQAAQELPLDAIKKNARFRDLPLVRQPRLSIMLLPDDAALELKQLTGLKQTSSARQKQGVRKL